MRTRTWRAGLVAGLFAAAGAASLADPAASAQPSQSPAAAPDPMQRFIRFHNELSIPIYPVISADQTVGDDGTTSNCPAKYGNKTVLRILVNGMDGRGKGIKQHETVVVKLPKTEDANAANPLCPNGLFYNAARIVIFTVSPEAFDVELRKYPTTTDPATAQITTEISDPWTQGLCQALDGAPVAGCWGGKAKAAYGSDAPGQLTEYTIISQFRGKPAAGGPNDPTGVSNIGFNISYVDDAYLPVAMALAGGATGYMGTALSSATFNDRLTDFLHDPSTHWSAFAAWSPKQFEQTTAFRDLVERTDKLPSGDIVLKETRTKDTPPGGSSYTYNVYNANDQQPPPSKSCNAPAINLACHGNAGNCCTTAAGPAFPVSEIFLACCDTPTNALIDKISRTYNPQTKKFANSNPTLTDIVARWMKWKNHTYNCSTPVKELNNPAIDKVGFCHRFQQVVDFLWQQFTTFKTKDECDQLPIGSDPYNQCVVASIVGYDIEASSTGFDPNKCDCPNLDPNKCPKQCTDEAQRTQSVQALLRGVPWTGYGDPVTCAMCPSLDEAKCPRIACVAPQTRDISPDAKQYHFDKFLHFWAPYGSDGSAYNLDPYARFIHNEDQGVDALSAYGFSIDDFYGFFGGNGTTLVVDVGGKKALDNPQPRDPFTQYFASLGKGWVHVRACGREFPITDPGAGPAFPISFWQQDGGVYKYEPLCEVVAYKVRDKDHPTNDEYVSFQLEEITQDITDTYTGILHKDIRGVVGVDKWGGGMFAARGVNPPQSPDDAYCLAHSTPALRAAGKCKANLSPHGNNQAYVGVQECASGLASRHSVCGRPLMNLNIPALP
jgi:hypothetical protein